MNQQETGPTDSNIKNKELGKSMYFSCINGHGKKKPLKTPQLRLGINQHEKGVTKGKRNIKKNHRRIKCTWYSLWKDQRALLPGLVFLLNTHTLIPDSEWQLPLCTLPASPWLQSQPAAVQEPSCFRLLVQCSQPLHCSYQFQAAPSLSSKEYEQQAAPILSQ